VRGIALLPIEGASCKGNTEGEAAGPVPARGLHPGGAVSDVRTLRPAGRDESKPPAPSAEERALRQWVARAFTRVEDVVYVGLGLLLAGSAVALLGHGIRGFGQALVAGELAGRVVELLDRILLVLMIVEILYTVQVSFREHALVPEPFLIVGLIAVTRRILVLTAEFPKLLEVGDQGFINAMLELGVLTFLVLVLVASVVLLRRCGRAATAEKA